MNPFKHPLRDLKLTIHNTPSVARTNFTFLLDLGSERIGYIRVRDIEHINSHGTEFVPEHNNEWVGLHSSIIGQMAFVKIKDYTITEYISKHDIKGLLIEYRINDHERRNKSERELEAVRNRYEEYLNKKKWTDEYITTSLPNWRAPDRVDYKDELNKLKEKLIKWTT